jgi:hypothetical protein
MAHTVVRDYERTHGGTHVESVTIIRTDADAYPSGWNYSLHYGEIGGPTLLRYDNAHDREKGHERHTPDGTERIEFPGMEALYRQFRREIESLPPGDTP